MQFQFNKILLFIVLSALGLQAQTLPFENSQFPCVYKDEAQRFAKDFKIKSSSFGGIELCKSISEFKKLINALSIIENGQFKTTESSSFIRGFIDSSQYYKWAQLQVTKLDRDRNEPQAIAINVRGTFYCDVDFASGGVHSVEMEYYARVSVQGQYFHPMYNAMARLTAMARANIVFNSSPLIKRDALLVQSTVGQFRLLDQGRWIEQPSLNLTEQNISGRLKRTSFGASVFTGSHAYAIELYERFDPIKSITDSFSYYKTLINLNVNLSDFKELDIGAKRNVVMITPSHQFSSYNFKMGKWNPLQNLNLQIKLTSPFLPDGRQRMA